MNNPEGSRVLLLQVVSPAHTNSTLRVFKDSGQDLLTGNINGQSTRDHLDLGIKPYLALYIISSKDERLLGQLMCWPVECKGSFPIINAAFPGKIDGLIHKWRDTGVNQGNRPYRFVGNMAADNRGCKENVALLLMAFIAKKAIRENWQGIVIVSRAKHASFYGQLGFSLLASSRSLDSMQRSASLLLSIDREKMLEMSRGPIYERMFRKRAKRITPCMSSSLPPAYLDAFVHVVKPIDDS